MPSQTIRKLRELSEDEAIEPTFRERARRIADVFERRIADLAAAGELVEEDPPVTDVEIDESVLSS